jgi:hypothetical protein
MSDPLESSPTLNLKASLKRPLKVALAVGVATAIFTLFRPNYYKSEAKLLPVDVNATSGMRGLAATAAALGVALPGGEGADANFVDILESRWMKERLLQTEYHFHTRFGRFGSEKAHQETLYAYLDEDNLDRALRALEGMFKAEKNEKTNVLTLYAETKSPELSEQMVRRATELLNQFVVRNNRTRGSEKAAFAEARLADARSEMGQAEAAFRAFLESNRNYQMSADPGVRLLGARLEAELSLRRQIVATLAMNREQALLDAKNDIPILNILDAGNLPIEKSRPFRSLIVLMMMALSGAGTWTWEHRRWLKTRVFESDDQA